MEKFKNKKLLTGLLLVSLVLIMVGGTFAAIRFTRVSDQNLVKSGKVSMSYTESSNVIYITNALPTEDEVGKNSTDYFDFTIMSKADTNADDNEGIKIPYNLIIEPKAVDSDKDALTNEQIKVYLTKVEGSTETEVLAPTKISELTPVDSNFKLYNTKNVHKNNNGTITTNYRLRAWIDYNVESKDWNQTSKSKQYKFGVNVNATEEMNGGESESQTVVAQDNSGANIPVLTENMIPVYYDESDNNWKKADITKKNAINPWYNYDEKKWANAVTVSDANRTTYLNANAGTTVPMSDINAMFVWIPRYKYTYFASNTPTSIPITFENGIESTGTIKCTDAIAASSDKSENCTDTTNGSIIKGTSTYTHPAFTFGNEELAGIWVGKFETSATVLPTEASTELRTVIIKPDVQSWMYTAVSYYANSIRNMELANNIYGFTQNGTTLNTYTGEISGDSNNLDTHMMKNMEWGAVTYLSHSKYGKNSEVFMNNSSGFYTGRSGGNVSGSTAINGTYTNQTSTKQYNTYGFYTYDGYLLNYDTNNKNTTRDLSKVASTTGNIYGIYDMSGGNYEYVMANMQDENNKFYPEASGTWSATNKPLDKYYDKYSYDESGRGTEFNYGKLGDATIEMQPTETTSWYDDNVVLLASGLPWLSRGGDYTYRSLTGLFFSICGNGDAYGSGFGSRVVLSVSP